MKAEEYLNLLTEQIRYVPARFAVRDEIRAHIEDEQAAYMARGLGREEAEVLAVRQMGDPVETGVELDRIHRPRMAWGMIALAAILSAVWMVLPKLLSVGNAYEGVQELLPRGLFALFCMGVMLGICHLDYSRIGSYAKWLAGGILLVGIYVAFPLSGMSGNVNGTQGWLALGGLGRLDLRLVLLLYVPLYAAILYGYRGGGYKAVAKSLLWLAMPFVLTMYFSNLTTAAILYVSCGILFTAAVCRKWYRVSAEFVMGGFYFATLAAAGLFVGFVLYEAPTYQATRMKGFFGMEGISYAAQTARTVLAGSRWLGRANTSAAGEILSRSGERLVEGDYMLVELGGYYGIVFSVLLVAVILLLLLSLLRACLRQKNQLGRIMGLGCVVVLLAETTCYILVNVGRMSASYWCPFVTYGCGGMLLTSTLLGILLSVYRYQNVLGDKEKKLASFVTI